MQLISQSNISGKKIIVRADLDVPLKADSYQLTAISRIEDDARLKNLLPTLEFLQERNSKVVIIGHLGRPEGRHDLRFSLEPVGRWLSGQLKINNLQFTIKNTKINNFAGWEIADGVTLLENLRFYAGEEANDEEFATTLATLGEVFVNDAFASCHRAHASIVGLPKLLPAYAGLQLEKEVGNLSKVLENPVHPLVVIIGGAKLETKLPVIENFVDKADYILVGGKIAAELANSFPLTANSSLPRSNRGLQSAVSRQQIIVAGQNNTGRDIDEESIEEFKEKIKKAQMIVWNGPLGVVEEEQFSKGSQNVAEAVLKSGAQTIVGGGDLVAFLRRTGLLERFSFVSSGGGAMLEFLAGKKLPGLAALDGSQLTADPDLIGADS